ncbi:glycosyl hydrolase [Rhypophila sp. PSN 637]
MKSFLAAFLAAAASFSLLPSIQAAKEVFAHVILGNTADLQTTDWESDITLAQEAKIDGFVLNVAFSDPNNDNSLSRAFEAAASKNFSLFFSFDYLALGPWPQASVVDLLNKFASSPAYFKQDDKPFVSTFEGPGNADDWPGIKSQTNCFFVPDWSSLPAQEAVSRAGGVVDGLFSFNAWPVGPTNMTTDPDKDFQSALSGAGDDKKYMMPVSPWFYTALPGLAKNWMWRGDNLWEERWKQVLEIQPDFVQILTWNDFGESHYIGPVRELPAKQLIDAGGAPVDYVSGNTHDGWRKLLPFYIEKYKSGATSFDAAPAPPAQQLGGQFNAAVVTAGTAEQDFEESVVAYYRTNPAQACGSGGTTGNNADFPGQVEIPPDQMVEDSVFYTALLKEPAQVEVDIGGAKVEGNTAFFSRPQGEGAGIYQGSVSFGGKTGDVVVRVVRDGNVIAEAKGGAPIAAECTVSNWNAVCVSS